MTCRLTRCHANLSLCCCTHARVCACVAQCAHPMKSICARGTWKHVSISLRSLAFVTPGVKHRPLGPARSSVHKTGLKLSPFYYRSWIRDVFCTHHPRRRLGYETHLKSRFLAPFTKKRAMLYKRVVCTGHCRGRDGSLPLCSTSST